MKIFSILGWYVLIMVSYSMAMKQEVKNPGDTKNPLCLISLNMAYQQQKESDSWSTRKDRILEMLHQTQPDIVGWQHAKKNQVNEIIASGAHGYPYGNLYRYFGDASTIIMYNFHRLRSAAAGVVLLNETGKLHEKGWDAVAEHACTWCRLVEEGTGNELYVFNMHLDSRQVAREKALALIFQRIHEIIVKDAFVTTPVILMGDFNVAFSVGNLAEMIIRAKFTESALVAKRIMESDCGKNSSKILPVDHVFLNAPVLVKILHYIRFERDDGKKLSDHLPIILWLEWLQKVS